MLENHSQWLSPRNHGLTRTPRRKCLRDPTVATQECGLLGCVTSGATFGAAETLLHGDTCNNVSSRRSAEQTLSR